MKTFHFYVGEINEPRVLILLAFPGNRAAAV